MKVMVLIASTGGCRDGCSDEGDGVSSQYWWM